MNKKQLIDQLYRMMVLKTLAALRPPIKVVSKNETLVEMINPGAITLWGTGDYCLLIKK